MFRFRKEYPAVIDWIAGQRPKVKKLAASGVGALIAAQANVFDNLKATTHGANIDDLKKLTQGPARTSSAAFVSSTTGRRRTSSPPRE